MNRLLKGLIVVASLAVAACGLSGCQKTTEYAVSTATLASGVLQLDTSLKDTAGLVTERLDKLTPEEQHTLTIARADVLALQQTLQSLIQANQGVATVMADADALVASFTRTRDSYRAARDVVTAHLHEFTPAEQAELRRFNALATRVNLAIETLTKLPNGADISQTLADVVSIAANTARLLALAGAI